MLGLHVACGWSDWLLYRRRVVEEEEPVTSTTGTQTDVEETEDDTAESYEMVHLREEVITTVHLHPAPTPSPVRRPPPQSSSPLHAFAETSFTAVTTTMTSTAIVHPEPRERLSLDDLEQRLHGRATGTSNVKPG